jgi:hypothetical protein
VGHNRRFGLVLAAACTAVFAVGRWHAVDRLGWLLAALALLLIALVMPRLLDPFRRLWLRLGTLMQRVVSPILLLLFYFLGVVPIGLTLRLLGRDHLRLRKGRDSYWIDRQPPGPEPQTMKELF